MRAVRAVVAWCAAYRCRSIFIKIEKVNSPNERSQARGPGHGNRNGVFRSAIDRQVRVRNSSELASAKLENFASRLVHASLQREHLGR